MNVLRLISSFRARLLLVLAALLILTLGTQYLLNLRAARANRVLREQQADALIAALRLGVDSIFAKPRLVELIKQENNPLLDPATGRVANVIVVDQNWRVSDSLDLDLLKVNGEYKPRYLQDLTTLPPVMNLSQLPQEDRARFPVGKENSSEESRAFPIETDEGRYYVIVVLKSAT